MEDEVKQYLCKRMNVDNIARIDPWKGVRSVGPEDVRSNGRVRAVSRCELSLREIARLAGQPEEPPEGQSPFPLLRERYPLETTLGGADKVRWLGGGLSDEATRERFDLDRVVVTGVHRGRVSNGHHVDLDLTLNFIKYEASVHRIQAALGGTPGAFSRVSAGETSDKTVVALSGGDVRTLDPFFIRLVAWLGGDPPLERMVAGILRLPRPDGDLWVVPRDHLLGWVFESAPDHWLASRQIEVHELSSRVVATGEKHVPFYLCRAETGERLLRGFVEAILSKVEFRPLRSVGIRFYPGHSSPDHWLSLLALKGDAGEEALDERRPLEVVYTVSFVCFSKELISYEGPVALRIPPDYPRFSEWIDSGPSQLDSIYRVLTSYHSEKKK